MSIQGINSNHAPGSLDAQQNSGIDSKIRSLEQKLNKLNMEKKKAIQQKNEELKRKLEKQIQEIEEQIRQLTQKKKGKTEESAPDAAGQHKSGPNPPDTEKYVDTYA